MKQQHEKNTHQPHPTSTHIPGKDNWARKKIQRIIRHWGARGRNIHWEELRHWWGQQGGDNPLSEEQPLRTVELQIIIIINIKIKVRRKCTSAGWKRWKLTPKDFQGEKKNTIWWVQFFRLFQTRLQNENLDKIKIAADIKAVPI